MNKSIAQFTSTSKINLYLDILEKDPIDGYHFLESIFYEIPLGDDFIIYNSDKDSTIFYNDLNNEIPAENTVSKSLRLFKEKFNITDCFKIEITKKTPMGAGLGSGSGNAGALLKWLSQHYNKNILDCLDIAQKVGSDVPFFLHGGTALVEGKGEKITPLPNKITPGTKIIIIYPGIHTSTKDAFGALDLSKSKKNSKLSEHNFLKNIIWDIDKLKNFMYNIFNSYLKFTNAELFALQKLISSLVSPDIIMLTGSGSSFILLVKEESRIHELMSNTERLLSDRSSIYILSV